MSWALGNWNTVRKLFDKTPLLDSQSISFPRSWIKINFSERVNGGKTVAYAGSRKQFSGIHDLTISYQLWRGGTSCDIHFLNIVLSILMVCISFERSCSAENTYLPGFDSGLGLLNPGVPKLFRPKESLHQKKKKKYAGALVIFYINAKNMQ